MTASTGDLVVAGVAIVALPVAALLMGGHPGVAIVLLMALWAAAMWQVLR